MSFFKKRNMLTVFIACMVSMPLVGATPVLAGGPVQKTNQLVSQNKWLIKKASRYKAGEIIVKYKNGTNETAMQTLNKRFGTGTLSENRKHKMSRLRTPSGNSVENMLTAFRADKNVEYAEPNYLVQASMIPNDSYYSYQWNLYNPAYGGINVENAWDLETGKSSVIVAVIDTGVAYEDYGIYRKASDLARTNFVQGYDFANNDSHPNDDNGHGTHVTGTLAQSTNNSAGVAGVAFGVSIMPIKVLDANGSGTHADVAEGIYYAADHGAKVINMSLGGSDPSNTLKQALAYAYSKGVTIVAASGNDGTNTVNYPAAYDDYVIAVGATRYDETRAYYSNGGSSLDLMAPGGDLTVDQNGDGYVDGILQQTFSGSPSSFSYWFYSGTSMATPHVAGVAALVLSHHDYDPAQVREALEQTAEDKGANGWDGSYGWGLVDAAAAVAYGAADVHEVGINSVSAADSAVVGETVSVTVTLKNSGSYDEDVTVEITDTATQTSLGSRNVTIAAHGSETVDFNWNSSGWATGAHNFTVTLSGVNDDSNTANNQDTFAVTLIEPVHDVLISSFTVPSETNQGTNVTLNAVVKNVGTYSETLTFTLTDATDNTVLVGKTLTLSAGRSSSISISWNTAKTSVGKHTLTAQLAVVSGETNTTDNTIQKTINIAEADTTPDINLLSVQAQSLSARCYTRAYVQNSESTTQTFTMTCRLTDKNGKVIADSGLYTKRIRLPAGYRGVVSWIGKTRLSRGTYTMTVSIPESEQTQSTTFQVR